jgi:hypothetical protein
MMSESGRKGRTMRRIAIGVGLGLAWTLAACGGNDEAQREAARKAKEATEVIVESAQHPSVSTGQAAKENTEVTVGSAEADQKPAGD